MVAGKPHQPRAIRKPTLEAEGLGRDQDYGSQLFCAVPLGRCSIPGVSQEIQCQYPMNKPARAKSHTRIQTCFDSAFQARQCVIPTDTLAPKMELATPTPCYISASTKIASFFDPVFGTRKHAFFKFAGQGWVPSWLHAHHHTFRLPAVGQQVLMHRRRSGAGFLEHPFVRFASLGGQSGERADLVHVLLL